MAESATGKRQRKLAISAEIAAQNGSARSRANQTKGRYKAFHAQGSASRP